MAEVCEETRHGFRWNAALVERHCSLPEGRVVIGITTDAGRKLDIYVSRTGRSIRVYDARDGGELTR